MQTLTGTDMNPVLIALAAFVAAAVVLAPPLAAQNARSADATASAGDSGSASGGDHGRDGGAVFGQGGMVLELNAAQDSTGGGCQLTMVATNETGQALTRAAWQVAVFDRGGVVRGLPILDFGALPAGKTRVALFDLPGRTCPEIARIVVNDVADCRPADGSDAPDLCLSRLTARSIGTIAFGL